jgi:hypothetical protein
MLSKIKFGNLADKQFRLHYKDLDPSDLMRRTTLRAHTDYAITIISAYRLFDRTALCGSVYGALRSAYRVIAYPRMAEIGFDLPSGRVAAIHVATTDRSAISELLTYQSTY